MSTTSISAKMREHITRACEQKIAAKGEGVGAGAGLMFYP